MRDLESLPTTLTYSITFILLPLATLYCSRRAMTSLLRSIVAGPRLQHEEAGLDLCYVHPSSPTLIAMSFPAPSFPKKAYRNPLPDVVAFLDRKHGAHWKIFEFRAEGTGYSDADVAGRIFHAPWPDHHPPPFALLPRIVAAMRNHLHSHADAVAVVHCKAGKGRSGSVCCSYLIAEEGWSADRALAQFTQQRMRPGFGEGVSIPSQRRWVRYVERWATQLAKTYVERRVRIAELHVWGLRPGVRVAVQGYVDEGKKIRTFHTFGKAERTVVDAEKEEGAGEAVVFRPKRPLVLPTSDVNVDFEKRSKAAYGWTMVTSIAHVWFNAFFEGATPGADSGVFDIEWKAMDGIKGTERKGMQALDRLSVVWEVVREGETEIPEPAEGEAVPQPRKAETQPIEDRDLGLKKDSGSGSEGSSNVASRAGSVASTREGVSHSPADPVIEAKEGKKQELGGNVISGETLYNPTEEEPYEVKESKFGSIKRKHRDDRK